MHRGLLSAAVVLLTTALMGPVRAENVLMLRGTLTNPAECPSLFRREPIPESATAWFGYNTPIINANYTIALGDWLEYEVLIPRESTMAAGGVDMRFTDTPQRQLGPELRSTYTVDQNGLFAHPGTNYAVLSNRFTQVCGQDGTSVNVPLFQRGVWYKRVMDLSKLAFTDTGDPVMIVDAFVAIDKYEGITFNETCPDPSNPNAIALFRNINIKNRDASGKEVVKLAIYNGEAQMASGKASMPVLANDVNDATLSVVDVSTNANP